MAGQNPDQPPFVVALPTDNSDMNTTLQNLVQSVNALNETTAAVFPQAQAISASAGAASGDYLTIVVNGTPYKIQLLLPA